MPTTTTDLDKIKDIAKRLLDIEITKTNLWPMIAQHPFTNTGTYSWQDENGEFQSGILERGTEAYKKWKEMFTKFIDEAENVLQVYMLLNKPWAMYFIKLTETYMSIEDFTELFKDAFTEMEQPNMDPSVSVTQLKNYFKQCDKNTLMEKDELEYYNALPEIVTVYRGVTSYNNKKIKVLSWTTSLEVAEWFANRYDMNGQIYSATIKKKNILAYFNGRNEFEIIVDPSKLKEIKKIKDFSEEE